MRNFQLILLLKTKTQELKQLKALYLELKPVVTEENKKLLRKAIFENRKTRDYLTQKRADFPDDPDIIDEYSDNEQCGDNC